MPKFRLRAWREQVLYTDRHYDVEAPTLEEAATMLEEAAEAACDVGDELHAEAITDRDGNHGVWLGDPDEIVESRLGIALVNEKDLRIRDLIGLATGEEQRGEPLVQDHE